MKVMKSNLPSAEKKALVVHPDMGVIAALQSEFSKNGMTTIVARDLPTALLAMTQHYFDVAVVSSRISEEGDGWPVGGILRLIFSQAFLVVIAPQTDVLTLKTAINNGIDEIYEKGRTAEEIASAIAQHLSAQPLSAKTGSQSSRRVQ